MAKRGREAGLASRMNKKRIERWLGRAAMTTKSVTIKDTVVNRGGSAVELIAGDLLHV